MDEGPWCIAWAGETSLTNHSQKKTTAEYQDIDRNHGLSYACHDFGRKSLRPTVCIIILGYPLPPPLLLLLSRSDMSVIVIFLTVITLDNL